MVDLIANAERLGEVRGLEQRGNAAPDRDVAAQAVGRLVQDPGRVVGEAARAVLGRHQREVELLAQPHAAEQVVIGERIPPPFADGLRRAGLPD